MTSPAHKKRMEERETFSSVDRAFQIIDLLADAPNGLTLSAIARDLDVNKAIADKLLNTLLKTEMVWRDDIEQTFQLTFRISNLGLKQLQRTQLLDLCSSELRQIAEETGELIRLAIVEAREKITWVYAAVGRTRALKIDPNYTLEVTPHAHATGKAWLATMPFDEAWKIVEQHGAPKLTQHTITERDDIKADLAVAAERGFAISCDESEIGVGAVAAPILASTLDGRRECVGCISYAAPSYRMNREQFIAMGPRIVESADRLGKQWPLEERTRQMRVARIY